MDNLVESKFDRKVKVLLRDYGYWYADGRLMLLKPCSFTGEVYRGRFNSLFAAAESLIPILRDDSYYRRWERICSGS